MAEYNVYLCGPILNCTDEECHGWRETAAGLLAPHRSFDPTVRDYRLNYLEHVEEIVEVDKKEILTSQAVLAYLPQPSAGSSMEIIYAWERNIPVFSVIPKGVSISPWVKYHSKDTFSELEDACWAVCRHFDTLKTYHMAFA